MPPLYKDLLNIIYNIILDKKNKNNKTNSINEMLRDFYKARMAYNIKYIDLFADTHNIKTKSELLCILAEDEREIIVFSEWRKLEKKEQDRYITTSWIKSDLPTGLKRELMPFLGSYVFF